MRHFCPDVPLCLTVDGDFDVSNLAKEYDLIVFAGFRGTLGRHVPFEFYVWLDSDAIVWGDFTPQVRTGVDFQIFGARFQSPAMPLKSHHGWRIFISTRSSCADSTQTSNGGATRTFLLAPSHAGVKLSHSKNGSNRNCGGGKHQGCLVISPISRRLIILFVRWHNAVKSRARCLICSIFRDIMGRWNWNETAATEGWHFPEEIARPRVAHFCGRKPSCSVGRLTRDRLPSLGWSITEDVRFRSLGGSFEMRNNTCWRTNSGADSSVLLGNRPQGR
jgi:hypothetical protein